MNNLEVMTWYGCGRSVLQICFLDDSQWQYMQREFEYSSKGSNKIAISKQCERNSMEEATLCGTDSANSKIEFHTCRRMNLHKDRKHTWQPVWSPCSQFVSQSPANLIKMNILVMWESGLNWIRTETCNLPERYLHIYLKQCLSYCPRKCRRGKGIIK